LANPTHDLDLIVVASRTKIFDLVTSLENHPVAGTQLIERMAGQAYRIVVSLFDPIKKNRVVRPSKGIELVALHLTPVTITVAIFHRALLVTANSEVLFCAARSKGVLDFLRQTNGTSAFRVYVYPQTPAARDPRSVYSARDVVFTGAGGSAALGYPCPDL